MSPLLAELHLQALFASLQGVAQQVEQGQLQTARVAFDRGQRLRAVGLQLQLPPGDFQLGVMAATALSSTWRSDVARGSAALGRL
ncbi:hypothetical protein ULF88_17680 [Halopseudomonas pachastrellae]|nr:hypothetical protein [Halopseudomonas pachastrellae]